MVVFLKWYFITCLFFCWPNKGRKLLVKSISRDFFIKVLQSQFGEDISKRILPNSPPVYTLILIWKRNFKGKVFFLIKWHTLNFLLNLFSGSLLYSFQSIERHGDEVGFFPFWKEIINRWLKLFIMPVQGHPYPPGYLPLSSFDNYQEKS